MHFLRTLLPVLAASFAAAAVLPFDHTDLDAKDLAGTQGVNASTVVTIIQALTAQASSLQQTINSVSLISSYNEVNTVSQTIISSLNAINTAVNEDVIGMSGSVFNDSISCQTIGDAGTQCALVLHDTLQALILRAFIFVFWDCAAPIAQELEVIQPSINSLANAVIQIVPCQTLAIQAGQAVLNSDCSSAITELS